MCKVGRINGHNLAARLLYQAIQSIEMIGVVQLWDEGRPDASFYLGKLDIHCVHRCGVLSLGSSAAPILR